MNKIRILLTGSGGQLGQAFARIAAPASELLPLGREALNVSDPAAVDQTVAEFRPDWIVNAAAYTAVDQAESHADDAFAINGQGAAHLAAAAARYAARMVHVSTDYVFDGKGSRPYRPNDPTAPLNVYGRSKLAGEQAVLAALGESALVLRTSWVYAASGRNFPLTMLRLLREREELRIVEDQVGTPTSASSLARAVLAAIRNEVTGVHHWTDAGAATWYDFAVAVQDEGQRIGLVDSRCRIVPIPAREYPTPAQRPHYSLLDKTSLRMGIGTHGNPWRAELRATLNTLRERR